MNQRGFIITGSEATGSVFISKCIANSIIKNDWDGHGFFEPNKKTKILHRSIPYKRIKPEYPDYKELSSHFVGCEVKYIICTRDKTFSEISKNRRFNRNAEDFKKDQKKCKETIKQIIESGEDFFIWNYETMVYLKDVYFDLLYDFIDIKKDSRIYPKIINGNKL